jgi:hypothetical protein
VRFISRQIQEADMTKYARGLVMTGILLGAVTSLPAAPLKIVDVAAPAINCVFNPACAVTVTDTSATITLTGAAGSGFLQSRTYKSTAGSAAAGRYAYEYRIDLRQAYGITNIPCVKSLSLDFGAPATLDYNGNTVADEQVYVVTAGGLGTVKPTSADRSGSTITFQFATPVCAGSSPGHGDSSYFFGLAAWGAPKATTATIKDTSNTSYGLAARVPATLLLPRPRLIPLPTAQPAN